MNIINNQETIDTISQIWNKKDTKSFSDQEKTFISNIIYNLDIGQLKICEQDPKTNLWTINYHFKQAIILYFLISKNKLHTDASGNVSYDKIPLKFANWSEENFSKANIRVTQGAIVRISSFIENNVVLMPCFVNVGAFIGENTLIDTWATIGSCGYVGKNCHISGGAGIGGVLEPAQSNPVIIEDNCFIGSRSSINEGIVIGTGSVISSGVHITKSTKIIDRTNPKSGETISYGNIPPYSVVIPGTKTIDKETAIYSVIIIKKVDEKTRSKVSINELLRYSN